MQGKGLIKMSLSVSVQKSSTRTNIEHNNRELDEKEKKRNQHIDYSRSDKNSYFKRDLKELYETEFGGALKEYNAKQKRSDRKIEDYYEHIKTSEKTHLQQEMIIQIGDKDDFENDEEKRELAKEILRDWVKNFEERNPQLKVYNASLHDDEASPHIHINFVPVATGYKRGLEKQVSFDRAILQQNPDFNKRRPFADWRAGEVAVLEKLLNERGIDRKLVGKNNYKDVNEYKERKDLEQEVEQIKASAMTAKTDFDTLKSELDTLKTTYKDKKQELDTLKDDLNTFKADLSDLKDKAKEQHENELETLKTSFKAKKQALQEQVDKDAELIKSKITDAQTDFDMINQALSQLKTRQEQELEQYKNDLDASKKEIKEQFEKDLKKLEERQLELSTENEKIERTNKQLKNISEYDFAKLGLNQATLDYFEGLNARMEHLEDSVVTDEDNQVKLSVDDFKELISVSKTSTENFKGAFKRTLDYREVKQSKNLIKSLYDNALSTVDELKTRNDKLIRFPEFIEEEGLVPRYNAWVRDKKKQKEVQQEKDDGLDL